MVPIEVVERMLEELAGEFPQEFYNELNGGILLLPDAKLSEKPGLDNVYILGEYHHNHSMGRYIVIYYGSFQMVYGMLSEEELRHQLFHTLRHEFTHHVESLAGEKGLEIKDKKRIEAYYAQRAKRNWKK